LHHLGVNMGAGHLQKGNQWNRRGYFEDLRWQKLNKQITGERYGHTQPVTVSQRQAAQYRALAELCNASLLWGMKDPRLCFTAQFIWPWLRDARVVAVTRSPSAAAASLVQHSQENYCGQNGLTLEQAMEIRDLWAEAMEERVRTFHGPVLRVRYEDLTARPEEGIEALAEFAFGGLCGVYPDRLSALQFIDPGLRHHG